MSQQVLIERFFDTLIAGDRAAARKIVDECLANDVDAETIIERLYWPALDMIEALYRNDKLSVVAHHYATRLLRMLADQIQLRLKRHQPIGRRVLLVCGPNEPDEIAGQLAADMLEARGFEVYFPGGGVANDEIHDQVGKLRPQAIVMFGSTPSDLPFIRQLIDAFHDRGICPDMQIVVGGGVFNRADGLTEEIGADLWARTPTELVESMVSEPQKRADMDQRTVGRRRRTGKTSAA